MYGGIEITENIRSFLKLPSGFRIYGTLEKVQAHKKAEEAACADRWDLWDREDREEEGQRMSPEEIRTAKDNEYREHKACTKEGLTWQG